MDHNEPPPIDGDDNDANNNSSLTSTNRLWTCDACGCNTNLVTSDRNCTICGTPNNPHHHRYNNHHGNFANHHHLHVGTFLMTWSFYLFLPVCISYRCWTIHRNGSLYPSSNSIVLSLRNLLVRYLYCSVTDSSTKPRRSFRFYCRKHMVVTF
jgi:hypothetical protein